MLKQVKCCRFHTIINLYFPRTFQLSALPQKLIIKQFGVKFCPGWTNFVILTKYNKEGGERRWRKNWNKSINLSERRGTSKEFIVPVRMRCGWILKQNMDEKTQTILLLVFFPPSSSRIISLSHLNFSHEVM